MTESQRHHAILEFLQRKRYITVPGLTETFEVSPATARRDINKLNNEGKLRKVRNGAEVLPHQKTFWAPLNIQQVSNLDEKVRISQEADALISEGESVVINCGSTAFLLGQKVCGKDVQVITNYFPLANFLIEKDHDGVVIIGGQYNKSQSIMLASQDEVSSLYAGHWMFTSGRGVTSEGLYKVEMLTAMAEQKMLAHIGKLAVLVDSSKIGQRAGMLFCSAARIDILITGKEADALTISELQLKGVDVHLV